MHFVYLASNPRKKFIVISKEVGMDIISHNKLYKYGYDIIDDYEPITSVEDFDKCLNYINNKRKKDEFNNFPLYRIYIKDIHSNQNIFLYFQRLPSEPYHRLHCNLCKIPEHLIEFNKIANRKELKSNLYLFAEKVADPGKFYPGEF